MSPICGYAVGTSPTYWVWLENNQIDTTAATSMAMKPAQFRYLGSMVTVSNGLTRRSRRSAKTTPSQGPIQ